MPQSIKSLEMFHDALAKYLPLNEEETRELIEKAQNGSEKSMEKILIHRMRGILKQARQVYSITPHIHGTMEIMDLAQSGYFGLREAVKEFDLKSDAAFDTCARQATRKAMTEAINYQYHSFRKVAPHLHGIGRQWSELLQTLKDRGLNFGPDEPIPFLNGMTLKQLKERADAEKKELRQKKQQKTDSELGAVPTGRNYEYLFNRDVGFEKLMTSAELKDKEDYIIRARTGLIDGREHTPEEIGQKLGLTRQDVERLEAAALKKLLGKKEQDKPDEGRSEAVSFTGKHADIRTLLESANLSDREDYVVRARAGLLDGKKHSLERVAEKLCLTVGRVQQVQDKAFEKILGSKNKKSKAIENRRVQRKIGSYAYLFEKKTEFERLAKAAKLPGDAVSILRASFGLLDGRKHGAAEIAAELRLAKEDVYQKQRAALKKLERAYQRQYDSGA